jgi:hypothetical protein
LTGVQIEKEAKPPLLRGWLIFFAIFIVLQLIAPLLTMAFKLIGFDGRSGYIELLQQAEGDAWSNLALAFTFEMVALVLTFAFWTALSRKFFTWKSGFAESFLKCLLLSWAVVLGIDVMQALLLGEKPSFAGYGALVFGLGLAQWLMHSPQVNTVFVR